MKKPLLTPSSFEIAEQRLWSFIKFLLLLLASIAILAKFGAETKASLLDLLVSEAHAKSAYEQIQEENEYMIQNQVPIETYWLDENGQFVTQKPTKKSISAFVKCYLKAWFREHTGKRSDQFESSTCKMLL